MIDFKKHDKILIIDNNMLRFHHYDLMESMLYYKPCFLRLKKEYYQYLKMPVEKQIDFLVNINTERNILKFFNDSKPSTIEDYSILINKLINYSGKFTPTILGEGLPRIVYMDLMTIYLYQYTGDMEYESNMHGKNTVIIKSDDILNKKNIIDLAKDKKINCIFCDSIDLAVDISESLISVLFVIPDYSYNITTYDNGKHFKHLDKIIDSASRGNEFAIFNNILTKRREKK